MRARPNLVVIVLDSVRRDSLSCHGYERVTTPNIDRLAESGVLYSRASAASCWTLPSHASLFTGLYPSQHRADLDTGYLDSGHLTLASFLSRAGYRTDNITCNGFIGAHTNLTHGFQRSTDVEGLWGDRESFFGRALRGLHRRWRGLTARDRGARRATRLALEWIRRQEGPFFLFLNYMDCHLPYKVKGEARYRFVRPEDLEAADAVPHDPFAVMAGRLSLTERQVSHLKDLYDGCLHYLDASVGQVLSCLRETGHWDDTMLVVTSDHGESFGEHGLMDHQYGLYESLLAVPLVVRFPGAGEGRVDERLTQHVDLLPTVISLVDAADPTADGLPGFCLTDAPARQASFAEYLVPNLRAIRRRFPEADVSRYDIPLRSISTARHKLIWRGDGGVELYELEHDPEERNNLAEARPDLVSNLQHELYSALGDWPVARGSESGEDLGELRERLEALGYL